ncbi:mannose-1-phosphate guanylyltransferase [Clostridium gasigenes]|uniref:mannose-1-phosphate guanylyltransferase n=1 Tax=Clostridium gasigenes TaxID=94869 RepID=UPI0014384435|nr:mannose-1-phosphate guanylyltransferase [Clostridium gasigenes]NKF07423.1 mannose-1-phosphate guanylyltransferase [Clostridium gasigenes]QSW17865.1 mannose-1-phosphate guanylyltransferase [Clostridium gasigenes]
MLCALIMAGGKGTRFWPLSTEEKPKQFLNLIGDDTMIQMTVKRILPIIPIERIFICTCERYVGLVKKQLPELPDRNIIIEPEGRNTAPCIALSALVMKRYYEDATMVVLPSDHLIKDENKFTNIIIEGNEFLSKNNNVILTLGMRPDRAETGYGYIKYGENVGNNVNKVEKFVEKPNKEKAEEYLALGKYLWNGGMFIWKADTIISKIKKYIPNTFEALKCIETVNEEQLQELINNNYRNTDEISIDYAILEKSNDIYVIPSEIGWDDIGSWRSIERYRQKDEKGNIITINTQVIESEQNMVINNKKRVVMIGVENILTIEKRDTIFVVNKNCMDNLKEYEKTVGKF